MYRTRIELSFDAGHRLPGYSGKCTAAHSHTFRAEVVVAAQELDPLGLTADFRELKATLKAWMDANWDDAFLLSDQDAQLIATLRAISECKLNLFRQANPSTGVIARALLDEARH
jgi:6-pyruvoyl-tetrahydropterin synthase